MHSCIYLFIYLIAYYPFIYVFFYCFFELMHVQELIAAVLQNCAELHAHVTPLSGKSSTGGRATQTSKSLLAIDQETSENLSQQQFRWRYAQRQECFVTSASGFVMPSLQPGCSHNT